MNRQCYKLVFAAIVATVVGAVLVPTGVAQTICDDFRLSGAIFTTNQFGEPVNMNIYTNKNQVYLDGGPGPGAPVGAAALPPGDYYFQVTDPAGKVLLSTDPVARRKFTVSLDGVIVSAYDHSTNPDADYGEFPYNARVVQLKPFDNTPNNGGVYKVWVTPVACYSAGADSFGFVPRYSKTDNFKVKGKVDQFLCVRKFKDCNGNGIWDAGEPEIPASPADEGWPVTVSEPDRVTTQHTTAFCILAWNGCWSINEENRWNGCKGWKPTALIVDEVPQTPSTVANVCFTSPPGVSEETHTVVFGNQPLSSIKVCKFYDRDGDGVKEVGEPLVSGIKFQLWAGDRSGSVIATEYTGADGYVSFCALEAGTYTVEEVLPPTCHWVATTDQIVENIIVNPCQDPVEIRRDFGNVITGTACFSTKGYWHNKNGLAAITDGDIVYVNGLAPYSSPSSYFDAGDEPFNGYFTGGTPVAAAYENDKITDGISAGAGTARAEISHFLVDTNAGGDPREQLAQQLLAFIFNVRHRLPSVSAAIELPGGGWIKASDLRDLAITAWSTGEGAGEMQVLLEGLNSSECSPGVVYVLNEPGDCVPTAPY
jgi:hypothetical protein